MILKDKWEQWVNLLKIKSPYDYERYIAILRSDKSSLVIRKIRAIKFLVSRVYKYQLISGGITLKDCESKSFNRISLDENISSLAKYDIISFDVFNTLLLRNVTDYSDVYHLVGIKLGINGFRELRIRAEQAAKKRLNKHNVSIHDIYNVLVEWHVISDEIVGIQTEIEVEKAVCEINPYWYEVLNKLRKLKKSIILSSDMYFSAEEIAVIIEAAGGKLDEVCVFSSCDLDKSKQEGNLFEHIKSLYGEKKKYIHIGDDGRNDFQMAKNYGMEAIFYKDVHAIGRPYRNLGPSVVQDSITNGIINVKLHSGIRNFSALEEFGFCYYGRLFVAYCQWIDKLVKEKGIQKLLFVSRDSYYLHIIYQKFFNSVKSEYIYSSRKALGKAYAKYDYEMFIKQTFDPYINDKQKNIEQLLNECGLPSLCEVIEKVGISRKHILTRENYELFREFLYEEYNNVVSSFEQSTESAQQYFYNIVNGYDSICVVDVGWFGSCTLGIESVLKKGLNYSGRVYGAHIGLDYNATNVEACAKGTLTSFCFSAENNYDLFLNHDSGFERMVDEIVFSAPEPSLAEYGIKNGNINMIFSNELPRNIEVVAEIHKGIELYVDKFMSVTNALGIDISISPYCAYSDIQRIMKNKKFVRNIIKDYKMTRNSLFGDEFD